jgi:hypothetical protein
MKEMREITEKFTQGCSFTSRDLILFVYDLFSDAGSSSV